MTSHSRHDTRFRTAVCAVSIIIAWSAVATVAARSQELRVTAADASGMTVEYRPSYTTRTIRIGNEDFLQVALSHGGGLPDARPGSPDIRTRSELVLLPSLAGNTVTVLETQYDDRSNARLLPVESPRPSDDRPESAFTTGPAYGRTGWYPSTAAVLEHPGIARDRIVGTLRFQPVQFDAARRIVRLVARMVIRVDFGSPDPRLTRRQGGTDDRALNAAAAGSWRIAEPASMRKRATTTLATGDWYRIDISEEGIYKLTKSWFQNAGIPVSSIDPRTIRMFNSGGRELPQALTAPRPDDLQEIAIDVVGQEDGRFDDNDYVLFYARGLTGFAFDTRQRQYGHYIHRYDKNNAYLLTWGGAQGKRIASIPSANDPSPYRPQWFTGKEFAEDEVTNFVSSGKLWVGKKITAGLSASAAVYTRKLEGLVSAQPVTIRMQLYSQSDLGTTNSFTVSDGITLGTIPMGTVDFNTDNDDIAAASGVRTFVRNGDLPDGRSTVKIEYNASDPDRNRGGYVDWVEWFYARSFSAIGDALGFSAPDTTAVCAYELGGFTTSDVRVYDVTDFSAVRRISDPSISGGTVRFQSATTEGAPSQYLAVAEPAVRIPGSPARIENSNLLGSSGAEYVIITASELLPAAEKLKAHRERQSDPMSTLVVTVSSIYNEFNSGVVDPTAIRNFLVYAMRAWPTKPQDVLLFGDGHYDYKNNLNDPPESVDPIIVPAWETDNSITLIDTYPTDDYYAQVVGDDKVNDLGIGRIPVHSLTDAEAVVAKIIAYESAPDFDPWRNRVTFVADDGLTTRGDDYSMHTAQSEDLAGILPAEIEQQKIYLVSYPTENTAQGRRKPAAAQAIIDQFNQGTIMMNWTGHGSESVWAHEQVFVTESTVPQLDNARRLAFVTAATCTFGLYDRPHLRSGTEALILKPDGGAVGVMSSPRVVYSGDNSVFTTQFYRNVFTDGRERDGRPKRLGDIMFATKLVLNTSVGYEKFHLFADPGMRLALPRYRASVDSIFVNGRPATGDTIQIRALSKVTIETSVRKADSSLWSGFDGTALVSLFDAERHVPVPIWGQFTYRLQGGLLYRGEASITDGRFRATFIVPKDISYENNTGRFAVYFDNAAVDGAGYSSGFRIGGSDAGVTSDTKGPDIQLFLDSRSFQPGDLVNESPLLIADLFDESGINTTGLGIGHDIEAWIDGNPTAVVLNEYYRGEKDSYQRGTVQYRLSGLSDGTHALRLRAWDIFNNSSTAETSFRVVGSARLAVTDVFPFPNPMRDNTVFTFQHNQSNPVDVSVKIYTLSGRLLRTIEERGVADRLVRVKWDGRDEDGDRIANGMYFYKISCSAGDGNQGSEVIGKLAVLR